MGDITSNDWRPQSTSTITLWQNTSVISLSNTWNRTRTQVGFSKYRNKRSEVRLPSADRSLLGEKASETLLRGEGRRSRPSHPPNFRTYTLVHHTNHKYQVFYVIGIHVVVPCVISHDVRRRVIIQGENLQQRLEASFQPNTYISGR